jgi:hypothetical protein
MKTIFPFLRSPFALLLFALAACTEDPADTGTGGFQTRPSDSDIPIAFTGDDRGAQGGGILPLSAGDRTTANLAAMTVYAHYTGADDFDAATASTPNFMFAQAVTKGGSGWTYAPLMYWPAQHEKVSFFAVAPAPGAANGIALVDGDAYTGYPAFTVTPPTSPAQQEDLCVASALNLADDTDGGKVSLHFDHTMAKVTFSVRYRGAMPSSGYIKIKQLYLSQVAKSGTLSLSAAGFSWDVPAGADNRTDYFLTAASGDLTGDDLLADGAPGSSLVSADPQGTLLLVPQTTSAEAEIQLVATFYNGATEKDYEIVATLPVTTWEAGKQVTYNLTIGLDEGYMTIDVPGSPVEGTNQWTYAYTGEAQTFIAPEDGYYQLEAWGAGGEYHYGSGTIGSGGYVKGIVALKSGQKLYAYVGQYGNRNSDSPHSNWNGGGLSLESSPSHAGYGGGATDFRLLLADAGNLTVWNTAASLNSRIMVAGAGGSSGDGTQGNRGHAGGLQGYDNNPNSKGGTQIGGGYSGGYDGTYDFGYFGLGGNTTLNYGGSGGGGYYGGAGGRYTSGQGSGGSSFISGMPGCVAINPTDITNDPRPQDSNGNTAALNYNTAVFGTSPTWNNDAEILFTNPSMIDGEGYEWNTGAKGAATDMPDWNSPGSTMTGNTGNGHARITLLEN